VILNDSRNHTNIIKRIVGDDRAHLLDACDKTIFFCQLDKPSVSYEKIILVAPPLSELEPTFSLWTERVIRLSKELSIGIELYSSASTFDRFMKVGYANKLDFNAKLKEIENADDFFLLYNKSKEDIIIFCSARVGSVSYEPSVENFSTKVEKACPNNDSIFIYPGLEIDPLYANYDDISATPILAGVETIQKIGREVGNIFKKSEGEEDNAQK
jgi:hypothetical protein